MSYEEYKDNGTAIYDYEWFQEDLQRLVEQLKPLNIKTVIGVERGGFIPGACLAYALDAKFVVSSVAKNLGLYCHCEYITDVIVAEDIIESGDSVRPIIESMKKRNINCVVATLLLNEEAKVDVDCYYGSRYHRDEEKRYFNFWWEKQ